MAVYDYQCRDCGEQFSRNERISEHAAGLQGSGPPVHCPKCESRQVDQRVGAAYVHTSKKS